MEHFSIYITIYMRELQGQGTTKVLHCKLTSCSHFKDKMTVRSMYLLQKHQVGTTNAKDYTIN